MAGQPNLLGPQPTACAFHDIRIVMRCVRVSFWIDQVCLFYVDLIHDVVSMTLFLALASTHWQPLPFAVNV